jgi:ribosomal protein S18 acetylase RimI-like enzyme
MTADDAIVFRRQTVSSGAILQHLAACDSNFAPPLSQRVTLADYSEKLAAHAALFEAWHGATLIGLVAAYVSAAPTTFFISNVSIDPHFEGRAIASTLMRQCITAASDAGAVGLKLEVSPSNERAVHLYRKLGFAADGRTNTNLLMTLQLAT